MGLFDFFRRKPAQCKPDLDRPRCHHYSLAHQALRSVAFENPLAFLGVLTSPDAMRFLSNLLNAVSERCKEREPRRDFSVEDLTVHRIRVGTYPSVVVEMPRPRGPTEAFFITAVVLVDLEQEMPDPGEVKMRFFTLEKGFKLSGPPIAILCEWTAEGSHLNFGPGPEPRLQAFVGAVEALLSKS